MAQHKSSRSRSRQPSSSGHHLPPRPPRFQDEPDEAIRAGSFAEYQTLKRIKLAEEGKYLIWERSPSPEPEPLLQAAPTMQEAVPTVTGHNKHDQQAPSRTGLDADDSFAEAEAQLFMSWLSEKKRVAADEAERIRQEEEDNRIVGPTLPTIDGGAGDADYGVNLRPGEGERMAMYVNNGKRIPRRGEIGMTSDQIEHYEQVGYVMSGSRHSKMNAVRIRKENQVYTAEEKAALAMFNAAEARKKEEKLMAEMKKLVEDVVKDESRQ